ncbi:MAG: chromosome segregation protein SMC, partial [Bacillota bacterium]
MLFKKIEMHGFKSFAEPITIEFNEGITGIVGPNGSGKSNISDAVRWVLGEQSPKMLRGGKMEEVIFNGTDSRKSRGMAEVTLVIDNSDGSLPIDYKEVAISRRMFRSGESEYHINGNQCRLRDIRELIMDTGIGVDGYSLIGQGKIADIISSKTESRREIFEEAAGIVAYRTKKADAERKLASTTINMNRVQDIIGEIEGRIDGLREDSEKAREYLELRDRNKSLEINIILKNVEGLERKNEFAEEDLRNVNYNLERLKAEKDRLEETITESSSKNETLETLSVDARDALIKAIDKLNLAVNKSEVGKERMTSIESSYSRISEEIIALEEKKERETANAASFMQQKEEADREAEEASGRLNETIFKYNEVADDLSRLGEEADAARNEIFRLTSEIAACRSEIGSMELINETLEKRKTALLNERDAGEDTEKNTRESIETAQKELGELKSEAEGVEREKEDTVKAYEAARKEERQLSLSAEELRLSLGRMSARLKTIEEMESNYEGYTSAVKHVMKSGMSGIHGVVAELIKVPSGYETAIETALGQSLQNIVCEDDSSARRAIRSLKENKAGRMTFLPIASIRGREKPDDSIKNEAGFVAFAPECISYDRKYENVMSYLLGRVVVVKDLESAVRISKLDRDVLTVTLEGEIINARGAITGGRFKHRTANILDRRAEMAQLEKDITEGGEKQEKYSARLESLKEEISGYEGEIESLSDRQRQIESSVMLKESAITVARNSLEEMKSSADKVDRELESIRQEQDRSARMAEEITAAMKAKQEEIAQMEKTCEDKLAQYDARKAEASAISEEITAARIIVNTCDEKKAHADDIADRINSTIAEITADIDTRKRELELLDEEKSQLTEGHTDIDGMIHELEMNKAAAEEHLQTVTDEKSALTARLATLNEDREELAGKIQTFQDQKYDLDVRKARHDTQLETYKEKLWEDFEVSYVQAMEFKSEDFVMSRAVKENR